MLCSGNEICPSGGCLLATKVHLNFQPLPVGSFRWVSSTSRFPGFDGFIFRMFRLSLGLLGGGSAGIVGWFFDLTRRRVLGNGWLTNFESLLYYSSLLRC